MPRSSSLHSWQSLFVLYAASALAIIGVSAVGIGITPSKGKSDSAFYGILVVALIVALIAWHLTEKVLRKSSSVVTALPFMVQTQFSPVWAVAAGATIMFSAKSSAGIAWGNTTVIEQTVDFSKV